MGYRVFFEAKDCVACNACVVACIDQNDTDVKHGEEPCRKPLEYELRSLSHAQFVYCHHCGNARCISSCPKGCLRRDSETGFVVYDDKECIGCGSCVKSCPFHAIHLSLNGKVRKCDGCNGRVKNGLRPACAANCPTGAIRFVKDSDG